MSLCVLMSLRPGKGSCTLLRLQWQVYPSLEPSDPLTLLHSQRPGGFAIYLRLSGRSLRKLVLWLHLFQVLSLDPLVRCI